LKKRRKPNRRFALASTRALKNESGKTGMKRHLNSAAAKLRKLPIPLRTFPPNEKSKQAEKPERSLDRLRGWRFEPRKALGISNSERSQLEESLHEISPLDFGFVESSAPLEISERIESETNPRTCSSRTARALNG
jgi:hypothetical protein